MPQTTGNRSDKDIFGDFTFSARKWSAPNLVDPEEIRTRLEALRLVGRRIKHLKLIGFSYCHTRDQVTEFAYCNRPEHPDEAESDYDTIPPDTPFPRTATVDEPLLIAFEDGDVFEITAPYETAFRFSLNCIPWYADAGKNPPNLDADVLFAPCIGKTVTGVEVHPFFTDRASPDGAHTPREFVSTIVLRLEDGTGLCVGADLDFCVVSLADPAGEELPIPFHALKSALFNWEDIHEDDVTGFRASSDTLFFGNVGAAHAGAPLITLAPKGSKSAVHVSYDRDFLLLEWAITWHTGRYFDEYGEYEFSAEEWNAVLDRAGEILSFAAFDDLFDRLTGLKPATYDNGADVFSSLLNLRGAAFWKARDKYRTQLKDVRRWTQLALPAGGAMRVEGF